MHLYIFVLFLFRSLGTKEPAPSRGPRDSCADDVVLLIFFSRACDVGHSGATVHPSFHGGGIQQDMQGGSDAQAPVRHCVRSVVFGRRHRYRDESRQPELLIGEMRDVTYITDVGAPLASDGGRASRGWP